MPLFSYTRSDIKYYMDIRLIIIIGEVEVNSSDDTLRMSYDSNVFCNTELHINFDLLLHFLLLFSIDFTYYHAALIKTNQMIR